jgi:hypothetical protein
MAVNPISLRYPFELKDQAPEVVQAHRYAFQGIVDLNQAIAALKSQLNAKVVTTVTTVQGGGGGAIPVPTPFPFAGLGAVNDQTGVTAYTNVAHDNGILLIFSDASPVAVTLDSGLSTPYFFFGTNYGAGVVTLTPTTGLINGAANWVMPNGGLFMLVFDATNWKTSDVTVLAQTYTAVTHQWLKDYNMATGAFTSSQPAFTDISGTLATAQLPASVPVVSFGVGAPAGSSTDGYLYFDTTVAIYVGYVYHSGGWNQIA